MENNIENYIKRQCLYDFIDNNEPQKRHRVRANGEGSIRKRKDGTYEARVTFGFDPKTGKQIRKSFYSKTRKEVKEKLDDAIRSIRLGTGIAFSKEITSEEWFSHWLATYKNDLAANSIRNYKGIVKKYLLPCIGKTKLNKITTANLQSIINKIPTERSTRMVEMTASVLRDSLGVAFKLGYITNNPALNLILPKKKTQQKGRALTQEQEKSFVNALENSPLRSLLLTYLYTGMRRGEALALTWSDIDFDNNIIRVHSNASQNYNKVTKETEYGIHNTKTISSIRIVPLSNRCKEILEPLKSNLSEFVFPAVNGKLMDINAAGREFKAIMTSIGLNEFTLHSLRHTFATRCLEKGVSPKVVQFWLGHASSDTTMDIYAHVNTDSIMAEIYKLN